MIFEPAANYQVAGLIIYYNGANYILFGRAYCGPCINDGDGFYMDNIKSGKYIDGNFVTPAPGTDTVFLRLRREGDAYTSFISEDGSHWTKIGTHTSTMKPKSVGMAAGQSTKGSTPAQFDYFVINKIP
jgi:beta-xylosidase